MTILIDLLGILFQLYISALLLRFWLQWARADFYNPLSQVIVRATDLVCKPLRNIFPTHRRYDWASLMLAFVISAFLITLRFSLFTHQLPPLAPLLIRTLFNFITGSLQLLFWVLIIRAVASWIVPQGGNPAMNILIQLTEPLLRPFRRLLPATGAIDFSPMLLMLLVWVTLRILGELM